MNKKVVVFGGGTGMSTLLRGLKNFPLDISAVVSVCDDGKSTGKLRKEFNQPAVGDIRRVIISLSETEPLVEKMLNYRFDTYTDLNGHTVGNLLLTAATSISGNMSEGIEALSKTLNLKGKVLPLTEDNVVLMAKMTDGKTIEGENNITSYRGIIKNVYYKKKPVINDVVLDSLDEADYIILSMGSLYTSILPNLICSEIIKAIDNSKAEILYVCNMMTQPGETDGFKVSDHIKLINKHLGKKKIKTVFVNDEKIPEEIQKKYASLEQKDTVEIDSNNIPSDVEIVRAKLVLLEDGYIRHRYNRLASHIFMKTIEEW